MTMWSQVEVGTTVVLEGVEHEVLVLKPDGKRLRAVLKPLADEGEAVAKIALRVKPGDTVELPEGAESPDRAGNAVEEILGAKLIATVASNTIVCPVMDVTLVAAHLRIIHGVELEGLPISSEDELLRIHDELHAAPFHEPAFPHEHEEAA